MSGGSQHNPNGRQSQLGSGWSPLQLQVANFLARAPQAHMASDRGVTWHTPTPPPHLYHVPAPSPPDPLQAMKNASSNSVFRHTATPPEIYRHTPTPPEKHLLRHTPSPGDVKATATLPPADLYPHLGTARDKLIRTEELLAYARGGVDLSLGGPRGANGSPAPVVAHLPPVAPAPTSTPAPVPAPALSVRDAPTINSLIARAAPHGRVPLARVDALLERLAPAPASPHSVIVHSRAAPTPSPPSSNEDSTDSCGVPLGSKRKRKPERTIRVPVPPPPPAEVPRAKTPPAALEPHEPPQPTRITPTEEPTTPTPLENGETHNGPTEPTPQSQPPDQPHTRRKTRSGSAETIDDIAAMIANTDQRDAETVTVPEVPETPVSVDKLKSVLASPEPEVAEPEKEPEAPTVEAAAAPRRRSARISNSESTNVPVESPSEAKPAEPEAETSSAEPTAASFVEVENQLEKMFAGLEEEPPTASENQTSQTAKAKKRRKSAPTKGERKISKRTRRASTEDTRRKTPRRKGAEKMKKVKENALKDAYDSGSNASSGRSRGPYIQIVGPCASPVSVAVVNAAAGEEGGGAGGGGGGAAVRGDEWRNGLRARGLHASTLGLRYDANTPDASWLCAFCERGPHARGLGDLFGPYAVDTDCEEYRALDEGSRRRFPAMSGGVEVWLHESCGVWASGVVACGARVWGLPAAVWSARAARCSACGRAGAALACATRACRARVHVPCAPAAKWSLDHEDFRAMCPRHAAPNPPPTHAPPDR